MIGGDTSIFSKIHRLTFESTRLIELTSVHDALPHRAYAMRGRTIGGSHMPCRISS